jgi:mono/diheme cytochrome c family protein
VIERINDVLISNHELARRYLLDSVEWGRPLQLSVRRGFPNPYATHPRLDLFLGSLSPHKTETFGCTICHQGQGSATTFKWASHTPDTMKQLEEWQREHGWFHNPHWIQPMFPRRFAQASCLQCHHEVVELEPSPRFPEPPAETLVSGYHVIRQYGCFGCHEINGFDGPKKRVGPDLRSEPNYVAAAQQLLVDPGLPPDVADLARQVVRDPDQSGARRQVQAFIAADAARAADPEADEEAVLAAATHKLAAVLADVEAPGRLRKAGPSLRYVASKTDETFLYNWIANPFEFRPDTRMPRFFGLHSHLEGQAEEHEEEGLPRPLARQVSLQTGEPRESQAEETERLEQVEVLSISRYLLDASQDFEYLEPPEGITEEASAERGKRLFELRGCLACHQHQDFPQAHNAHGPNLSRIGTKLSLDPQRGRKWLYSWVREPSRYHARTKMPNVFLEPINEGDDRWSDPAADVTEYLLGSQGDEDAPWRPHPVPDVDRGTLEYLAELHLRDKYTQRQVDQFLEQGIPDDRPDAAEGDESVLIADFGELSADERDERLLLYVGRRSVAKYGCSGCHDIPGFEDAKPIGTGLANWARKDLAQLAFEQIGQFIAHKSEFASGVHEHAAGHAEIDVRDLPEDTGLMLHALLGHQREGFLWQKLREPRSYDYKKVENKGYNERLRMPKFALSSEQVGAVMTFVLGLVADPPAAQYVYQPDPRQRAIVQGRQVLEKYNCAGCHTLQTEQFEFEYDPTLADFDPEELPREYPPLDWATFNPHFSARELEASTARDARGMGHARITAMLDVDDQGQARIGEDDDGNPAFQYYLLWKPAAINGQTWLPPDPVPIHLDWARLEYPPIGGDFARLIHPIALARERLTNKEAKYQDAWGWVPPPLVHQGQKVQPAWLHAFLLDPYPIRPAVVLRMPKFNMSPAEAGMLVDYFRAADGLDAAYNSSARTQPEHLALADEQFPGRLEDAFRVVTDGTNYCVKCHLVGDYVPKGSPAGLAPQLTRVHDRIQPDFLYRWILNPKRILPYTGMPTNFDQPVQQKAPAVAARGGPLLNEGTIDDQLSAVVDLLLNYDAFVMDQVSVKEEVVEPVIPPAGEEGAPPDGEAEPADDEPVEDEPAEEDEENDEAAGRDGRDAPARRDTDSLD